MGLVEMSEKVCQIHEPIDLYPFVENKGIGKLGSGQGLPIPRRECSMMQELYGGIMWAY